MQPIEEFTGLGMPVFTAFGWAGEETALKYAYSQLEQYIELLQAALPPALREEFPYYGLKTDDQSVYLAAEETAEDGLHIIYNARPMSLETQLAVTSKAALVQAYEQILGQFEIFQQMLSTLDPGWILRIQQLQIDQESGEHNQHQDLYKGLVADLDEERLLWLLENAQELNNEDDWLAPIYFTALMPSDQAAAMQKSLVPVMAERLTALWPLIAILLGRSAQKPLEPEEGTAEEEPKPEPTIPAQLLEQEEQTIQKDDFVYICDLKPLHIKRGFVNMTTEHWPFFAVNARTESRQVIAIIGDERDEESSVWRLQPNNLARLVLGPKAQDWLEDNFSAGDYIQLTTTRISDSEIEVVLEPIS